MAYFNFNENYNNKLHCVIFTTIRKYGTVYNKDISINDTVEIRLNGSFCCNAKVLDFGCFDLEDGRYAWLLALDTGLENTDEAIKLLKDYGVEGGFCNAEYYILQKITRK